MLQGQTRPAHGRPADPVRARAGGRRAAGRVLRARRSRRRAPQLTLLASYASGGQRAHGKARRPRAKAWSASARSRSSKILLTNVPPDYVRIASGPRRGARRSTSLVLPVIFEGQVQAACSSWPRSSASTRRTRRSSTSSPKSIGIVLNTIEANMRTEDLLKQSQSLAQRTAEPAGGAAADQRGAAGEGAPARPPEPGGRAQEPGSRAGPPGAGGEGQAARADLEVQVRVPGEHVARAAHAAQQPADPVRPAVARTPTAT